ncbi:MAG TPA: flagellar biosynthesis anti-sigma factor FlgM [Clostridia bacterium]|nr:flagellar biosynthesis anti-sigma factor FlgM [Clostridia bacterium]
MRIDLHLPTTTAVDANRGTKGSSGPAQSTRTESHADETRLSNNSTLELLQTRMQRMTEIRQERVDSLRGAISAGTYELQPSKIAESIFTEFFGRTTLAIE